MPLTDTEARQAKPRERDYKLSDGAGLYLLIKTTGSKYWRWKYRFAGKEKLLAFGAYPGVRLAAARDAMQAARVLLRKDIDPSQHRRVQKLALNVASGNTFGVVAEEWFKKESAGWVESHRVKQRSRLDNGLLPWLRNRPIVDIGAPELLEVLRKTEARGKFETARRLRQIAGHIFRYAIATGRAERDPSADLRDALATAQTKHMAAITEPVAIGPLLLALDGYTGTPVVQAALRLAPLTFVRPNELRQARWAEIDLETAVWSIPARRMKMRTDHLVPLSTQSVEILKELQSLTGQREFVFPGGHSPLRPMSENAVNAALRRLGIGKDEMTGHGFRAMARTVLDEVLNVRVDYIEHQLAHLVRDTNGKAYNRTAHLPARRLMMQQWADYLDSLRAKHLENLKAGGPRADHANVAAT